MIKNKGNPQLKSQQNLREIDHVRKITLLWCPVRVNETAKKPNSLHTKVNKKYQISGTS